MMKFKLIMILCMFIVLSSFAYSTSYIWCYQESANDSSLYAQDFQYGPPNEPELIYNGVCGQIFNGTYGFTSGFNFPDKAIDGKWTQESGGNGNMSINYTKPSSAINGLWMAKQIGSYPVNYSIPDRCWDAYTDKIVLRTESTSVIVFFCWNSTSFEEVGRIIPTATLVEEAIWWNVPDITNLSLTFIDVISNTQIEGETFSIYLEKSDFSQTYSTTDNPYIIPNIDADLYTQLKVSSTNYPERQYLNIDLRDGTRSIPVNFTIYLINATLGAEKTFYVRGSSLNALEDVYINFTRVIEGTRITIAEESTDYDGAATLYLDENYEYVITFSKNGYDTKTISLEPINDEYIITLVLSIAQYNVSVYEGLRYKFSPSNTILNNNTKYNFTFTLNSSIWLVTNCTLQLKNGTTVLSETSSNTANSCFLRIEYNTGTMTNITSEARYELESLYNFTLTRQYRVIYTYEGEFSLKNFLDDLSDFSMAGFDSFGRMMMAFIVIFVILILAGREIGFENKEILIIMFMALVGFFSYINWFYLDWVGMPEIIGLKKYFIFYLMILIGFGYMFNKMRK